VKVPDHDIELTIGTIGHRTTVMIRARCHRQIQNESGANQNISIPHIAINAVCKWSWRPRRVIRRAALSKVKIDEWCRWKVWMYCNAQKAAFRSVIDGYIQYLPRLEHSINDPQNAPIALLEHQDVAGPEKCHRGRLT